jgi:hypothetical protein
MSDRKALIIPSLLVIGGVGAIKSTLVPAIKWVTQSTSAKSGSTAKTYLAANTPQLSWESFAAWGGGVALLSVISLSLADTENVGDVVAAVLALAATSVVVINWSAISTALPVYGGSTTKTAASSTAKTQAASGVSGATSSITKAGHGNI